MDKPIYVGFAIIKLIKLLRYENYYDKIQPYFRQKNLQCRYRDTDSFVLSMRTENNNKNSKKLENICNFSLLDENHELFSNKTKKNI